MTGRRPPAALLVLPVLAAAGLGLWGIGFGLPFAFRPDEDVLVGRAVAMAVQHSLDPRFYVYPPLGIDAMALAEWLLGLASPASLGPTPHVQPGAEYLAARLVSVAAFAGAAGFVGLAGRAAYGSAAGLLAAASFAVAPLAVQQAHFARVDMLATMLVALATWLALRARTGPDWILAGVAAGLGAGTKYTSGAVLVVLLVLVLRGQDRRRNLLVGGGAAGAAFLLLLFSTGHPGDLASGIRFLGGRSLAAYPTPIGFAFHPLVSLPAGLLGAYLLALAGLALALWRRCPADLALAAFVIAYYLAIGFSHEVFIRYALPLLPALCLLAGGLLRERDPLPGRLAAGVALAGAVLLLPSLAISAEDDHLLTVTDTRILAARWLDAHAPAGSELRVASYWPEPFFDGEAIRSEPLHPLYRAGDPLRDSFQLGLYTDRLNVNRPGAGCFVYTASGPPWQGPTPAVGGEVLAVFSPTRPGDQPSGVYDTLDAFYLPLLAWIPPERPGPSIVISRCP